jgi:hypothetical protein
MPQIRIPKESLEGLEGLPPGIYDVRLDGFKPKWSKDKSSVNLQPIMIAINSPDPKLNDGKHRAFDNMNSQCGWIMIDFCHAFGELMAGEQNGVPMEQWTSPDVGLPGEFLGDAGKPEEWKYVGPLLSKVGKVEIVKVPGYKDPSKQQSALKRYFCVIPGCQHKHADSLIKN